MKPLFAGMALCLTMLGLPGCSTTAYVPISVMHPADIDLTGYKQIAMGDFSGDLGMGLSDRIKQGLVESPSHFQVLDRSRLNQIMGELRLSQTELVDPRYRAKAGRLLGATVLITGRMNKTYQEDYQSSQARCKSKDRGEYTCWSYTRQGVLNTSGSVDVIDLQTGQVLKSKLMNDSCAQIQSSLDERPARIDVSGLTEQCLSKRAADFLRSVSVWRETISVAYEKDKALPELERGIALARFGNMAEAESVFASIAMAAGKSASVEGKSVAKAYWNMGLTQLYTRQYDKAIGSFKKAFAFHPDEKYLQETRRAEYMRQEHQKLTSQLNNAR